MDFENKLSELLQHNLTLFESDSLCVEDIILKNQVEDEFAKEIIFSLYKRGFVRNTDDKIYNKPSDIRLGELFRLTVDGLNYLEFAKKEINSIQSQNVSIQVGNISGNAVIGNNLQNVSVHFGMTFEEVRQYINNLQTATAAEKIQLKQLAIAVQDIIENNKPISRGILSKFSSLLRGHSAAVATVFQPFIYRLFNS